MAGDLLQAETIKCVKRDDQDVLEAERCISQFDDYGKNEAIFCLIMRHSEAHGIFHIVRTMGTGWETRAPQTY